MMHSHKSNSFLWKLNEKKTGGATYTKYPGINGQNSNLVCLYEYNREITPGERRSFKLARSLRHRNIACLYEPERIRPCCLQRSLEILIPCHSSVTSVRQNKVTAMKNTEKNCAVKESRELVDDKNNVEHEVIVGLSLPLMPTQTSKEFPMNDCKRKNHKSLLDNASVATKTDCHPSLEHKEVVASECSLKSVAEMLDANENFCGLEECEIVNIIKDMAKVVDFLRQECVVHKKITPENVSLFFDKDTCDLVYKLHGFTHYINIRKKSPGETNGTDENNSATRDSRPQGEFTVSFHHSNLPGLTRTIYNICTGRFAFSHPLHATSRVVRAPDEEIKDWLKQGLSQNYRLSPSINIMLYNILLDLVDNQKDDEGKLSTFVKHVHALEAQIQVHICHIKSGKCTSVYVAKDAKVESLHSEILKEMGLTEVCVLTPDRLTVDLSNQICSLSEFLNSVGVSSENPLLIVTSDDESSRNSELHYDSKSSRLSNHGDAEGEVMIQQPTFAELVGGHVTRVMSMVQSSYNMLHNMPRILTVANQAYRELKLEVGYMRKACFQCNKQCYIVIHQLQRMVGCNCWFTGQFAGLFRILNFFQKQQSILDMILCNLDPKHFHSFTSKVKAVAEKAFKRVCYEQDAILSIQKNLIQCKDGAKGSHNDYQLIKTIECGEKIITQEETKVASSHEKLYNKITEHMNAYTDILLTFQDMLENICRFKEYLEQTLGSMLNQLIYRLCIM